MHKLSLDEEGRCQSPVCNYNRGTDSVTSQHESPSLASDIEVQQEIWKEREVFCEKRPWCSNRINANTFLFTICRKRELWYFREREERSQGFPLEEYPYLPVHICVCIIQPVTNANLFTPSYPQTCGIPITVSLLELTVSHMLSQMKVRSPKGNYTVKHNKAYLRPNTHRRSFLSSFGLESLVNNDRGEEGQRQEEER